MKRLSVLGLVVTSLAVGGCESTKNPYDPDKPLDKMSKEELCSYYAFYLTNPSLSESTRRIATTKRREKGCAG